MKNRIALVMAAISLMAAGNASASLGDPATESLKQNPAVDQGTYHFNKQTWELTKSGDPNARIVKPNDCPYADKSHRDVVKNEKPAGHQAPVRAARNAEHAKGG